MLLYCQYCSDKERRVNHILQVRLHFPEWIYLVESIQIRCRFNQLREGLVCAIKFWRTSSKQYKMIDAKALN